MKTRKVKPFDKLSDAEKEIILDELVKKHKRKGWIFTSI
jgi:hypothetical protein